MDAPLGGGVRFADALMPPCDTALIEAGDPEDFAVLTGLRFKKDVVGVELLLASLRRTGEGVWGDAVDVASFLAVGIVEGGRKLECYYSWILKVSV